MAVRRRQLRRCLLEEEGEEDDVDRERCWYVKEWLFVGRKESERNGEEMREGECQWASYEVPNGNRSGRERKRGGEENCRGIVSD